MEERIESAIEQALTGGTSEALPSRRDFPRYSSSYPILLEFDEPAQGSPSGVTVNLSRSGLLGSFGTPIPSGASCRVIFLPGHRYRPELVECPHCGSEFPTLELPDEPIHGTVVRVERTDPDAFLVAVMFDVPLNVVDAHGDAGSPT